MLSLRLPARGVVDGNLERAAFLNCVRISKSICTKLDGKRGRSSVFLSYSHVWFLTKSSSFVG